MQYVKVPETGKVYDQSVIDALEVFDVDSIIPVTVGDKVYRLSDLKKANAVDPFAFDTNIQNLTDKKAADLAAAEQAKADLQAAADAEIAKEQAEKEELLKQFPELKPVPAQQVEPAAEQPAVSQPA